MTIWSSTGEKQFVALQREKIETYLSEVNKPLLKTNELFRLKFCSEYKLQQEYIKGNQDKRRKLLDRISKVDLSKTEMPSRPILIEEIA